MKLYGKSKKIILAASILIAISLIISVFSPSGSEERGSFENDSRSFLSDSSKKESSLSTTLQVDNSEEENKVDDSSSAIEEYQEESYAINIDESSEEEKSAQEPLEESSEEESVSEEVEISLVSITPPISAGSTASITVQGEPDTDYSITVMYSSGPSSADGLETKTSDSDGIVSWSWKIGARTKEGTYRISISGGGKSFSTSIEIT